MTTQTSLVPPKIGQVRDAFVRSDPSRRLGPDDLSRLRRFVTWCGVSTSMEAVPPFKIEEFLAAQTKTSQPPRLYMPALKAFFAYALEQGMVESDPMRAVRLPRGAGSAAKRSTSATSVAPPRTAAPPTPSSNGDTPESGAGAGAGAGGVNEEVVYLSRERLGAMQVELERLKNDERHRISQMLHEAIKDGDLSENAAYDDAKMRQGLLEARIRDLESKVRHAEIIEDQVRRLLRGGGREQRASGGGRLRGSAGLPGGGAGGDQPPQREDLPPLAGGPGHPGQGGGRRGGGRHSWRGRALSNRKRRLSVPWEAQGTPRRGHNARKASDGSDTNHPSSRGGVPGGVPDRPLVQHDHLDLLRHPRPLPGPLRAHLRHRPGGGLQSLRPDPLLHPAPPGDPGRRLRALPGRGDPAAGDRGAPELPQLPAAGALGLHVLPLLPHRAEAALPAL